MVSMARTLKPDEAVMMSRIDQWGRGPVLLIWILAATLSFITLLAAFELESQGAELAAAVTMLNTTLFFTGAMAVTWRWLTS